MNELTNVGQLREKLNAEKEQLLARLNVIDAFLAELGPSGAEPKLVFVDKVERVHKGRKRAPRGLLVEEIRKVVAAKPGSTNPQIRESLITGGYRWPLKPEHLSKNLSKMTGDKLIVSKRTGKTYKYYPK